MNHFSRLNHTRIIDRSPAGAVRPVRCCCPQMAAMCWIDLQGALPRNVHRHALGTSAVAAEAYASKRGLRVIGSRPNCTTSTNLQTDTSRSWRAAAADHQRVTSSPPPKEPS
jgi:hypothetical protein